MKVFFTFRKIDLLLALILLLLSGSLLAQSTSNRGTDFWLGYMAHLDSLDSHMDLFITSDVNTSGTVSIPGQAWSTTFTVTANAITDISIPPSVGYNACSDCIQDKGIHITSVLPVVVYSEIYYPDRSDATLVLPVSDLGKEYYTMAYTQTDGGLSEFLVVATEDSTQVEITTSETTLNGYPPNVPFTVPLNKGQVYQVQSPTDLTGSYITTYSSGNSPCKRIAVFTGSTWCGVGCSKAGNSKNNLFEQCYPVNAWGHNFITAPFKTRIGGDIFRIFAGSDSTSISINGGASYILNKTQFTDTLLATANYITASKPITVAQYSRTQSCDGATGDPSMVILLPVEQILDTITVYSNPKPDMSGEYINVIMKTADTSSFRLDGNHVPFSIVQFNPLYSYSRNTVDSGNHVLLADSGFNAIAYGFGDLDAYSYCAGANVRNLNLSINVNSEGVGNPRTLCNGATVNVSGVVPYNPGSVTWYFGDGDTASTLSATHTYHTPGKYTISLVTIKDIGNSCATKDSSTYVLNITSFNVGTITALRDSICQGTLARLTVTGNAGSVQWQSSITTGNFTNITGATNTTFTPTVPQTTYFRIYTKSGSCVDTSATFKIITESLPVARYNSASSGRIATFNSDSSSDATSYFWDFGDGLNSSDANPKHTYDTAGTYHVCLTLKNNAGCNFTLCQNTTVFPDGVSNLNSENEFQIYPNPFGNSVFIDGRKLNMGISNIAVYDLLGRMVFNQVYDRQKMIEVPLVNLSSGVYYLEVRTGDTNYFQPVIKQRAQ